MATETKATEIQQLMESTPNITFKELRGQIKGITTSRLKQYYQNYKKAVPALQANRGNTANITKVSTPTVQQAVRAYAMNPLAGINIANKLGGASRAEALDEISRYNNYRSKPSIFTPSTYTDFSTSGLASSTPTTTPSTTSSVSTPRSTGSSFLNLGDDLTSGQRLGVDPISPDPFSSASSNALSNSNFNFGGLDNLNTTIPSRFPAVNGGGDPSNTGGFLSTLSNIGSRFSDHLFGKPATKESPAQQGQLGTYLTGIGSFLDYSTGRKANKLKGQQLELMRDKFRFEKDVTRQNLRNAAMAYNEEIKRRASMRGTPADPSSFLPVNLV